MPLVHLAFNYPPIQTVEWNSYLINGLSADTFPKDPPITSHQPYLDAIAYELNNCPRATLGYCTPTEAFNELIATTH